MENKMKIMLVDDDSTFRFIFKKQLEKDPTFEIQKEAVHGDDALAYLQSLRGGAESFPDMIVLDINMPVMDGWQFLDAYAELSKKTGMNIPVCMLSSTINQMDFDKSKTYNAVKSFFTKPLTQEAMDKMKAIHKERMLSQTTI